ncbi:MAG TPA: GNAT family N-acetyltransferase [Trebonia sp.]|jgi:GNAT superfamily N-acetyltransferase|nr:GNAT family N-acetyltransferase [Trebonia sp.]
METTSTVGQISFRDARRGDVMDIVALLADDEIGAGREVTGDAGVEAAYWAAFDEIESDPRNRLIVAESAGAVIGTLQLTILPGLSRRGMRRALIEAVRVSSARRGQGTGRQLITWAVEEARRAGCGLVQLTSDKRRESAIRFYESLGFEASHEGLKLVL